MICPLCGQFAPLSAGRCPGCGAAFAQTAVATGVVAFDTTGLPPGASFGAMSGSPLGDTTSLGTTAPPTGMPSLPTAAGPLHVGQSFGPRYHIIKLLGAGGMGAVYQAWDSELNVAVAVKVIRADRRRGSASTEAERRFKNELLLARQVTHKNVVRIHDLGEIDGIKYITMPYIQGHDLAAVLRRDGQLPIARALHFARQVAAGLEAAHEAGVVHRDLKPPNIMVGADDLALIMDFGISASREEAAGGSVVGTPEYMAPEQSVGEAVDARADIYAFGLILYEMLTGMRRTAPASPHERFDAMKRRVTEGLPPARSVDPSISIALDAVVMRCMERDRTARFQTSAELSAALAALDDNGELIPIPARVSRRTLATALVVVIGLLVGTSWLSRGPAIPVQHEPVSVLIADFDNRVGDADFNGSLEQPLGIAVEAASFITTYNRDEARKLITQLKLGTTLDESSARLLAMREGIKVILAGSVEASGSGYALKIKALNPTDGATIATASASASKKTDVLQRVGTAAAKIRKELGDTTSDRERLAASETVTAASLEAVREYSLAQDLLYGGKDEEAIVYYKRAIERDPNLGRAYSGWGISATNLGRKEEAAEAYKKALSLLDRMTEREKYRMLGTYYLQVARNYPEAINNYSTLVKLYPYDRSGHGNLALAYFYTRDFSKALEEGRRSIENGSRNLLFRNNYALYAMYAGDFKSAADEARAEIKMDPALMKAYLPLAVAAIADGNFSAARAAYDDMGKTGAAGASLAALGLADLAMYEGRFGDAESLVKAALTEDEKIRNTAWIAAKLVVLAEADLAQGKTALAVASARRVIKMMGREPVSVLAARILARAGVDAEAEVLAQELSTQLQPESRAYGKMIEGEIALHRGGTHTIEAVEAFLAAQKLADLWLARVGLGIAYVEAEHYAEGVQVLEAAQKRRGEATAIFLDDLPSVRYLAPVSYWLARAQEGLGLKPTAAENYKKYVALRAAAARDPLAADARRRLSAQ
jgi:serine/threonine protein kinase/tetratricopeptide (TPR) repeat protein